MAKCSRPQRSPANQQVFKISNPDPQKALRILSLYLFLVSIAKRQKYFVRTEGTTSFNATSLGFKIPFQSLEMSSEVEFRSWMLRISGCILV